MTMTMVMAMAMAIAMATRHGTVDGINYASDFPIG